MKKNNKKLFCQFLWNHSILSFLIMFLLTNLILWNSVDISYSQNLSSSSSLKANAGEDQYVEEGKPVILNAEDSISSDPPIDSFKWVQLEPKTPIIDLENGNTSRASFTSPNLPSDGYFIFGLVVKDQNVTDTDTVNVYVVEDLASTDKEITGNAGYQPEICFDGVDNDLDGKIDLQDEECGLIFSPGSPLEGPLQGLLPPQSGGIPTLIQIIRMDNLACILDHYHLDKDNQDKDDLDQRTLQGSYHLDNNNLFHNYEVFGHK